MFFWAKYSSALIHDCDDDDDDDEEDDINDNTHFF